MFFKILLIHNGDESFDSFSLLLEDVFELVHASSFEQGLDLIETELPDITIYVWNRFCADNLACLKTICGKNGSGQVLMYGCNPDPADLIAAGNAGVLAFLSSGLDTASLNDILRNCLRDRVASGVAESTAIPYSSDSAIASLFPDFIGETPAILHIKKRIVKLAACDANILITGESGTGKEIIARSIHRLSPRNAGAFVPVNCGCIPDTLQEAELFGTAKNAYTGAVDRRGYLQFAHNGTLFLDEIGEMNKLMQVRLLRTLEDRQIRRLGENREQESNFRLITATNRNLRNAVKDGSFRQDLFYRIRVIPIDLPPLRKRKADIPLLSRYFLGCDDSERFSFTEAAERKLIEYDWPGNIRELHNVVTRATFQCADFRITEKEITF